MVSSIGNPQLRPEAIESIIFGFDVDLGDLLFSASDQLRFSAYWTSNNVYGFINQPVDPVYWCYRTSDFASPACGENELTGRPAIVRDPVTAQIVQNDIFPINNYNYGWRGLDAEFQYQHDFGGDGWIDKLWVMGMHTYTQRVKVWGELTETRDGAGLIYYPKQDSTLSLGASNDTISIAVLGKRRGRGSVGIADIPTFHAPPKYYLDANIRLNLADGAYVQLGVFNVTNTQPPVLAGAVLSNTFANFYDVIGRRFSLSTRFSF